MVTNDEQGHARGFGRYLDGDMKGRPHTADEAEQEREERGNRETETDNPSPRLSDRLGRSGSDRGFGRYLD